MKWKQPKPVWWGMISTNSYLSFLIILRKWKGWQRKAVLSPLCIHTCPATQGCSLWLWKVIIPGHPQTILIWFWSRDLKKAFQGRSTEKKDLQPWGMQCLQLREISLGQCEEQLIWHTLLWVHYFEHVSVTLLSLFYLFVHFQAEICVGAREREKEKFAGVSWISFGCLWQHLRTMTHWATSPSQGFVISPVEMRCLHPNGIIFSSAFYQTGEEKDGAGWKKTLVARKGENDA